jgi:membrane-bound lytic murein transglycosylase D
MMINASRLCSISLISVLIVTAGGCANMQNEPAQKTSTLEQSAPAAAMPDSQSVEMEAVEANTPIADIQIEPPEKEALPVEEDEIWVRVRVGFSLNTHLEQSRVQSFIDWHQFNPDYLHRVTARGEPFLHFILEEIESRDMPTELVLLPIVESAFVPYAYSHGRAAGIWQFIPSTGRYYGLKQNWWYDGRRDIYAATNAALDYLQTLNKQFDGDWLLALAAYNAGAGNVRKAIRKNERRGRPTDFWSLDLPKETKYYVPKLLALAAIVENPEAYDLPLWPVDDEPYLTRVDTGGQLDLAVAAEIAGMDMDELYTLNPGFNRWATDPDGPHYLLLPISKVEQFSRGLKELPEEQRVTWLRHRIKSGQTLSHIADDYHTTVKVIKEANGIRGSNIRAGKYLLVPTSSKPVTSYTLTSSQRLQKQQAKGKGTQYVHLVGQGDTLWDISREHGISTRQLAKWNGMAPGDTLRLNQKLVIWKSGDSSQVRAIKASYKAPVHKTQKVRYTVRKGDSLSSISTRFKVSVKQIRSWNNLSNSKYIHPGQKLTLHVDITRTGS